ncbi:MAG: hypothetical protein KDD92_18055, partial [Caldilineaceae bacterium]|nr:hypothetical protein [Caldilineaceae bacterium]
WSVPGTCGRLIYLGRPKSRLLTTLHHERKRKANPFDLQEVKICLTMDDGRTGLYVACHYHIDKHQY